MAAATGGFEVERGRDGGAVDGGDGGADGGAEVVEAGDGVGGGAFGGGECGGVAVQSRATAGLGPRTIELGPICS